MSNYVKSVDYSAKDALATGNPNKIIKGAELNDEFNAIATAIGTKADLASPTFLGNPSATTQPLGNNSTRLATTAFVQSELNNLQANVAITGGTIDDVDITGGSISGLDTPLEVASGGTGKATLLLNSVLLGNGTNPVQEVAPSTSGNILTSNGTTWQSSVPNALGVGQSWQNVVSSRAIDTNYTNDTGKPIMVSVGILAFNSDLPALSLFVDGILVANSDAGNNSSSIFVTTIVPNGSIYRVTRFSSVGTLFWAELR